MDKRCLYDWNLTSFYGDFVRFYGDFVCFYWDLVCFYGVFLYFYGIFICFDGMDSFEKNWYAYLTVILFSGI